MFASLAKPDDDAELHWLKVRFVGLSIWSISVPVCSFTLDDCHSLVSAP
jgi:hypothetical protein